MYFTEDEWLGLFVERRILYHHDLNPRRPHAVLAEGDHTGTVFNGDLLVQYPVWLDRAASDLVERFYLDEQVDFDHIDCVVAPAIGGIKIGGEVARHIARHKSNEDCRALFTQKRISQGIRTMVFERGLLRPDERAILADDITTAGGTKTRMIEAVKLCGGIMLPHLLLLFNRSGRTEIGGLQITALVTRTFPVWSAEECSLCRLGSKPMRVKGTNWNKFTAINP